MGEPKKKSSTWKSAIRSKGLKVNHVTTKLTVSKIGQIIVQLRSKKDPCGICGRKTMAHAVLCKSCGNWIHGRCAGIRKVTNTLAIDLKCKNAKIRKVTNTLAIDLKCKNAKIRKVTNTLAIDLKCKNAKIRKVTNTLAIDLKCKNAKIRKVTNTLAIDLKCKNAKIRKVTNTLAIDL